ELDGLASWGIGDRLLTAMVGGSDPDAICAAEAARGLLPPGELGRRALADARAKAEAILAAARAVADGPRRSLEIDVALADGRHIVGTVPDVVGSTIRRTTFSKLGPKPRLQAWVHLLAATAAHPQLSLTSATIGRGGRKSATFALRALDHTAAVALLTDLVAMRDEALREPLPLYCETSHAYVAAAVDGDDPEAKAAAQWTTEFDWPKEDKDAEHLLVLGGERSFDEVAADPRFARLAHRLWDPIFVASRR
ncbi:MAG: exodeoxyribonuclease V subunit gamma, partial [Ilumatobacteraceae bacterium]